MIELRFVEREVKLPDPAGSPYFSIIKDSVLQYRTWRVETDGDGISLCNGPIWTDWQDVPVEVEK